MDPIENKLNMLIDGMEKKEQALVEIVNITENQRTVIDSGLTEEEIRAFILQMNREKQSFIKTVLSCDAMFEQVLKEIGASLDDNPELYKPQIADLQARIRRVMDLDVKIRVSEDQNNRRLSQLYPLRDERGAGDENIDGEAGVSEADMDATNVSGTKNPVMPLHRLSTKKAPPKSPMVQDDTKAIKAYEKNTRNYKG